MRHVSTTDAQRQMEREARYGQKPPVGQRTEVVSVFPAEAAEIAAATRCVSKHAVNVADRTDLLEALGLVQIQAPKTRTITGKTDYGRGTCPYCSRRIKLGEAGLILTHRSKGRDGVDGCPGSGREPKAAEEVPA